MTKAFQIAGWRAHYETAESKRITRLAWVATPNGHDSVGYCELLAHESGMAHYGAWNLILQVASKCPIRGLLVRDSGKVHSAMSIAMVTRGDLRTIEAAIPRLLEIGWLELVEHPAQPIAGAPQQTAGEATSTGEGITGQDITGEGSDAAPPLTRLGGGEQDSGQPDSRTAARRDRDRLKGILIAAGCTLKIGREDIMHEWVTTARGYSPEWIQRMLAIVPNPTRPSDLKSRLRKHHTEWENRPRSPPGGKAPIPDAPPQPQESA